MKAIKVMRLLSLTFLAVVFSQTSFAAERIYPSLDENLLRDEVVVATSIAEIKTKEAQKIINDTRQEALQGKVAPITAVKIIKEQNAIIQNLQNALDNKIKSAVAEIKKADEEQSYLPSFVSGVIAPFKSGYGYTEEQKATAQKVIDGLMEQQAQLTKDYEKALQAKLTPVERDILKDRYQSIITELNDDIYQQQLITGAEMSTQRKLFWAAVAAGAAVAGVYLLAPGTEITPKLVEEIKEKIIPEVSEPVVPEVITGMSSAGQPTVTSENNITPDVMAKPTQTPERRESDDDLMPTVEPGLPAVEPGLPAVEPGLPAVEPGLSAVEPGLSAVEPGLSAVEPGLSAVDDLMGLQAKQEEAERIAQEEVRAKAEGQAAIAAKEEERRFDAEVIGMESAYNDAKDLFNNFVDETKAFLEKRISLGDEKAREFLQGLEERIAENEVDDQLARGRSLDEIREDFEGAMQALQNAKRILEEQGLDALKQHIKSIESGEKLREDGQETIEEQPKKESLDGSSTEEDAVVKGYGKIPRTEEEEVVLMKLRDGLYEELGDYSDELRALLKKADESTDPLIRNVLYNKIAKQTDGFWVIRDSYVNRLQQANNPEEAYVQLMQELAKDKNNFMSQIQQMQSSIEEINEKKQLVFDDLDKYFEKRVQLSGEDQRGNLQADIDEMKRGVNYSIEQDMSYSGASTEDIINGLEEQRKAVQNELEKLIIVERETENIIKKIDEAEISLFDLFDQGLAREIKKQGEENRVKLEAEAEKIKNDLIEQINGDLRGRKVDPQRILENIEYLIENMKSMLAEEPKQIEKLPVSEQGIPQPENNQLVDGSGLTDNETTQLLSEFFNKSRSESNGQERNIEQGPGVGGENQPEIQQNGEGVSEGGGSPEDIPDTEESQKKKNE